MRIVVCGGRDYTNVKYLRAYLTAFHAWTPISELIEGGARGADSLARTWAIENSIPSTTIYADWKNFGTIAGRIRNRRMVELKPDAIIAFPGGRGTANMTAQSRRAGIKVYDGSFTFWTDAHPKVDS